MYKKTLSVLLTFIMVFSAIPLGGLSEYFENIDFSFISTKASAASTSDLSFKLKSDGNSYYVSDCNESASDELTIPSTYNGKPVTSIGKDAFRYCSITKVTIPDSIKSIGDYAFYQCFSLMSVIIPGSVTSIGAYAFCDCGLISVTIPDSVTSISNSSFCECSLLTSINVSADNKYYSSTNGVLFNKNKTKLICCPGGKSGSYTISNSVTSIGWEAFRGCRSLTSVTIPDSVTSIGGKAFCNCYRLTSIIIPNGVTSIGYDAFFNTAYYKNSSNWENGVLYSGNHLIKAKTKITDSYTIKQGTKCIADDAFSECSSLTSITIPNSVTNIGGGAFSCCRSLTSVTIGNSVTSIGSGAFSYCGITKVTIPGSVKSIGECAFEECGSLTKVTIPDSVKSIGKYAFMFCSSLTSITIPKSVTSIGVCVFDGCSKLTIKCYKDTVAHKYVKNNNIPYTLICEHVYENGICKNCKAWKNQSVTPVFTVNNSKSGVNVKWDKVSYSQGYIVYRKAGSESSWKKIKTLSRGSTLSYCDTDVKSGTKYTYTVRAYNGDKKGSYNKTGKTVIYLATPTVKTSNASKGVSVKWNKIAGAKGYIVYRKVGSGSWERHKTLEDGAKISFTDTKVQSGKKYSYYVKAYNGSTKSSYKSSSALLYLASPKLSKVSSNYKLSIKWGKVAGAKSYELQYCKSGSLTWKTLATTTSTKMSSNNIKGTYKWRIRAINGNTKSVFSSTLTTKS